MTGDAAMAIIRADNEINRLMKMKRYSKLSSQKTIDNEIRDLKILKQNIYDTDKSAQPTPVIYISKISNI